MNVQQTTLNVQHSNNRGMTRVTILLLFGCLLCGVRCGRQAPSLYGSWERLVREETNPFVMTLEFGRDGRYKAWHEAGFTWGEWVLSGSRLTIADYDCKDYVGTYLVDIGGQTLTFRLVRDPSNRPEVLPGTWTRTMPGKKRQRP